MPSQEATQQMIEEEVGPITATLDNLEYEMDSRTDSLQAHVDGKFDNVHDSLTALEDSLEDRFAKKHELETLKEDSYWRESEVEKRFVDNEEASKATAGDVVLLSGHIGDIWEFAAGMMDEIDKLPTYKETSALWHQLEGLKAACKGHHKWLANTKAWTKALDESHQELKKDHAKLQKEVADIRYALDVDHITSSSLIYSVNKLEHTQTLTNKRGRKRKAQTAKTTVANCEPRRRSPRTPRGAVTDSLSQMTQLAYKP